MSVRIEPGFPIYAVPRVWQWIQGFKDRVADDYSPKTLDEFMDHWERAERAGRKTWQIIRDEELGGVIQSTRFSPMLADVHVLFKKSFWGRATTLPAMRLVFEEMFADELLLKITSYVFRDNAAMIALAKSIGFEIEGTHRGHTMRGGKPVDMVALSLTKERFNVVSNESVRNGGNRKPSRKPVLGPVDQLEPKHQREQQLVDKRNIDDSSQSDRRSERSSSEPIVVRQHGDTKSLVDHSALSGGGAR